MELLGERPTWSMSGGDLLSTLDTLELEIARLESYRLKVIGAIDSIGYAADLGARDTAELLRFRYRLDATTARRTVRLVQALCQYGDVSAALDETASTPAADAPHDEDSDPETSAADAGEPDEDSAAAGEPDEDSADAEQAADWLLRPAQADAIISALNRVPSHVPITERDAAERELVKLAAHLSPGELRRAGDRMRDILDTDGPEPEERKAYDRESLALTAADRGVKFRGYLANENAELLRALIHSGARPHKTLDGEPDPRSREKRQADALTTALHLAAAATDTPHSTAATPSPAQGPTTPPTPEPRTNVSTNHQPDTNRTPTASSTTDREPDSGSATTRNTNSAATTAQDPGTTGRTDREPGSHTATDRTPSPPGTDEPHADSAGTTSRAVHAGTTNRESSTSGTTCRGPSSRSAPDWEPGSDDAIDRETDFARPTDVGSTGTPNRDITTGGPTDRDTSVADLSDRDINGNRTTNQDTSGGGMTGRTSGSDGTTDRVAGFGGGAQITVTIDFEDLKAATAHASGQLVYGDGLSAATIRRLACDAKILPLVLGSNSEPLDVGRCVRLVTRSIRRALNVRDRGCVVCGAPPVMCDAHHLISWIDGGETKVSNLVLLCRRHHVDLHHGYWNITITNGMVHVARPPWAEPSPRPKPSKRPATRAPNATRNATAVPANWTDRSQPSDPSHPSDRTGWGDRTDRTDQSDRSQPSDPSDRGDRGDRGDGASCSSSATAVASVASQDQPSAGQPAPRRSKWKSDEATLEEAAAFAIADAS